MLQLKNLFSKSSPSDVDTVLQWLNNNIPHQDWFIAGSFAMKEVDYPGDVDVFFYSEEGYTQAVDVFKNPNKACVCSTTPNAMTLYPDEIDIPVQFVRSKFGSISDIFDSMDLNVCRKAIKPDGSRTAHPSAHSALRIDQVNSGTFYRYLKYLDRSDMTADESYSRCMEVIDTYIADSTPVVNYYEDDVIEVPTNVCLYAAFTARKTLRKQLQQQAMLHAPELMI